MAFSDAKAQGIDGARDAAPQSDAPGMIDREN
jgi:hypothetical protein